MSDGEMPWGALAFMVILYTFLGAAFAGGMIDANPGQTLTGMAGWEPPEDIGVSVAKGGAWSWVPIIGGVLDGLLGAANAAIWGVLGILNLVWNLLTFNIVGLPDFFRVPAVCITLPMLSWIVLCFAHKVKSTINPLGG